MANAKVEYKKVIPKQALEFFKRKGLKDEILMTTMHLTNIRQIHKLTKKGVKLK